MRARAARGSSWARSCRQGWVGKPWALQQGLEAASGELVVSLDADTRPWPGLVGALDAALADADWVTCGPRFVCDTAGERWLHPSMLAGLVYRFGPSDVPSPGRIVANGQCTAAVRERLLAAGGYRHAAGQMTDDAAQARGLAAEGWRVAFRDAGALLEVKMHDSAAEVWREWGRSLALPGVEPRAWQAADVAVVWLAMGLPVLRALTGRPRALDLALLAVRCALLAGAARHLCAARAGVLALAARRPGDRRLPHAGGAAPAAGVARPDLLLSAARPNSAPIRPISAPVPITRSTGSKASWIAG